MLHHFGKLRQNAIRFHQKMGQKSLHKLLRASQKEVKKNSKIRIRTDMIFLIMAPLYIVQECACISHWKKFIIFGIVEKNQNFTLQKNIIRMKKEEICGKALYNLTVQQPTLSFADRSADCCLHVLFCTNSTRAVCGRMLQFIVDN